ncbi:hypothetical protein Salat_2895300 [Sesamum alatum]|uniref:Uncharacterized protein n=1 Tax=Sesamum alatum TaxID=300844 RepID=A0AAE1XJD5_9LAMI|nr:hypothetical protein Salat_2895300 [Sesamum alatum]
MEVPLAWRPSLNELPPINFEVVRERVKGAGLPDHGFRAKTLLEEDLLTVASLHPAEDTYTGRQSSYSRLRNTRSASATPSDIYSRDTSLEPPIIEAVTSLEADMTLAPSLYPPQVPFLFLLLRLARVPRRGLVLRGTLKKRLRQELTPPKLPPFLLY